ncbi:uncharacterized protein Z520_11156 [Fonsecaea multimorphosa CBS 102226]|uniref:Uncharacterized protein n=1 Tax=Fonsecaea multimorphosa CBS 102226 TaxID=1442371 RepID=A0A0D2JRM9_9EURO|nr:uncharacterized protein Z520_11156 [Fonsecaea multimorphosa CBS 102226]KIX93099.1 hypothetical protein Z520_11156 [Fonsecaea multimorphosa CBS 102226]OAL18397.1 hypothetical protein AYO22_10717 [Fonsecaea multimorphosa]
MAAAQPRQRLKTNEDSSISVHDSGASTKIHGPFTGVTIEHHPTQVEFESDVESARWLTVSPYLEPEHLLDLNSVDTPNRLLALASTQLEPASGNYATVPYEDSFDWSSLMALLKSLAAKEGYRWTRQEFYVVEFRSKLKKNIDVDLLFKLDKQSHVEATQSGGLLKYWYGVPDTNRRNLATCFWRNKEDAVNGGRGPWHKKARAAISSMYEEIDVKGLRFTIEDDVASWAFSPYS